MPGMMKKKKTPRAIYRDGEMVKKDKKRKPMMYGSRKPMRMGTRYGMSDGGPMVIGSMEQQKPQ
tara:strand:- start:437 stop:628 length:192 start_codon:yes stop_codon:yes gene_type:complete